MTLAGFARHEIRLAWRDVSALAFAGTRRRRIATFALLVAVAILVHLLAWSVVAGAVRTGIRPDRATLVAVTGAGLLSWLLVLSQGIETVTRAFYARGDLDLILSSPADARRLFAVRIVMIAAGSAAMAMLLAAPALDVLAILDGPAWLGAHAAVAGLGIAAAALATALTAILFRVLGPRRTRLAAQVVAAVIGAAFAIVVQGAAILVFDDPSRLAILTAPAVVERAPAEASLLWWPARALLGDPALRVGLLAGALVLLALVAAVASRGFSRAVLATAGLGQDPARRERQRPRFRSKSPSRVLREKEWLLLARDPWLVSQTLMQILYLVPAALLLWRSFGEGADQLAVLVPVLVMAAGQLAGGLAWLAVSGEDAPDLVATAPVRPAAIVRAKIEAVLGIVALVAAPILGGIALLSPPVAVAAAVGIALAAASATAIQLWFRSQARRDHFRRRQTSSRLATFAEAFSSILWACAAAFAAGGIWILSLAIGIVCGVLLVGVRAMRPAPA